jgi:AAA+ ATPase superfamily predicted ATPase
MKDKNNFFPQGLALGNNFCNRNSERLQLKNNIDSARPTLVMSPRRYGKTSLVLFVLHSMKAHFVNIDLFSELNEVEVQNTILSSIGDILYKLESTPKKALKFVMDFFSEMNLTFKLSGEKIKIEFSRIKKSPAKTILEALMRLDEALKIKNKRAVLFLDEFQRLSQITNSSAIEGSIRHVAQESNNIVFIFSGSNRDLLNDMFDDRKKPLYKLCDRLTLERISEEHYLPFIKEKFQKKWLKGISDDLIALILMITEKHPYYVNVLCHKVWAYEKTPAEKDILAAWHKFAMEERTNILSEIDLLSKNQAKMLIAIAKYGDNFSPMSKGFIGLTGFSLSSASQAINTLEKKDYLHHANSRYKLTDPLIKYLYGQ